MLFILATTEPHRIPATIASRCQRMDFRRLSTAAMVSRMQEVLISAGGEIDPEGLIAIARAAEGGMRDALSLADQCLSFCGNKVAAQDVYDLLGSMDAGFLFKMTESLLKGDAGAALAMLDRVTAEGRDLKVFTRDLALHFRALLFAKLCGHCADIIDCSDDDMSTYLSAIQAGGGGGASPRLRAFAYLRAKTSHPLSASRPHRKHPCPRRPSRGGKGSRLASGPLGASGIPPHHPKHSIPRTRHSHNTRTHQRNCGTHSNRTPQHSIPHNPSTRNLSIPICGPVRNSGRCPPMGCFRTPDKYPGIPPRNRIRCRSIPSDHPTPNISISCRSHIIPRRSRDVSRWRHNLFRRSRNLSRPNFGSR